MSHSDSHSGSHVEGQAHTRDNERGGVGRAGRTHARVLTERDRAVLLFVGTQEVTSLEQLARRFWPQARISTAQDRLTQLVRSEYLQARRCYASNAHKAGELVYSLTRKAVPLFPIAEQARLHVGLPPANDMKHRLMANEVRLLLEEQLYADGGRLIGWHSERELRADCGREVARRVRAKASMPAAKDVSTVNAHAASTGETGGAHGGGGGSFKPGIVGRKQLDIADARAVIQNRDGAVQEIDIEIDGQYYGKMLEEKAASLGRSSRPVLWACSSPGRVASVTRAVQGYPNITVMQL